MLEEKVWLHWTSLELYLVRLDQGKVVGAIGWVSPSKVGVIQATGWQPDPLITDWVARNAKEFTEVVPPEEYRPEHYQ